MNEQPGNTTIIQELLVRLDNGDDVAREELIKHSMERLRRLARKMLRQNPAVRRWNETDDVFQNALVRLNRALHTERPESKRRFVGLAATQIRRELIDLWRHHYGPEGDGNHHKSDPGPEDSRGIARPLYDPGKEGQDLGESIAIHEAVDSLTDDQKDVFEKRIYMGMTHEEIATEMQVSLKTVKRRWREAKQQLAELLAPESDDQSASEVRI